MAGFVRAGLRLINEEDIRYIEVFPKGYAEGDEVTVVDVHFKNTPATPVREEYLELEGEAAEQFVRSLAHYDHGNRVNSAVLLNAKKGGETK